jgi:hypothetical protein
MAMTEVISERVTPNSELFEELPGIRLSLLGEDENGNDVVARLGKVRVDGKFCSCGCQQEFMVGGESVLVRPIGPELPSFWNRYTYGHFQPVLDSWTNVRTLDAVQTTDKALEQRERRMAQRQFKAEEEAQKAVRRGSIAAGGIFDRRAS